MIDDTWDSVVEPFATNPAAAVIFAQTLFILKQQIKSGPEGCLAAIETLEHGIEALYPYTDAHKASYRLYLLAVAGALRPEHDPVLIARKACPTQGE